jgi:hypothetical protein
MLLPVMSAAFWSPAQTTSHSRGCSLPVAVGAPAPETASVTTWFVTVKAVPSDAVTLDVLIWTGLALTGWEEPAITAAQTTDNTARNAVLLVRGEVLAIQSSKGHRSERAGLSALNEGGFEDGRYRHKGRGTERRNTEWRTMWRLAAMIPV